MQTLLIEDNAMLISAISQGLNDHGITPSQLTYCKDLSILPTLLHQQRFDAVICRQYRNQGREGVRLLQEAHYLELLEPGCVLLLLDGDDELLHYPPSDLYFPLHLPIPFTTEQLTHCLHELVLLTRLTRPLSAPLKLGKWNIACTQCEDLLDQHQQNKTLGSRLARIKGYMLQEQDHLKASRHYAMCSTKGRNDWWARKGMIHSLLRQDQVAIARQDLARNQTQLPSIVHLELNLACLLQEAKLAPAWEMLGKLLQQQPWQPEWRRAAILLAVLLKDEDKTLEQARALNLRFFTTHKLRQSIEHFILNASLAVLWRYPTVSKIESLHQEFEELLQTVPLRTHEYAMLQALMQGLEYRFDEAIVLLAKSPPETARDNHLNLLLGFAVSLFCGLPHHARRYLTQLTEYLTRVALHPLTRQLFHQLVAELGQRLTARAQRLDELRQTRHQAMQTCEYQTALQAGLQLLEEFPALPGDAWKMLELLQHCWPAGMTAPKVARLVDSLELRLQHSPSFMERYTPQYHQTLHQIRSHLKPHLSNRPAIGRLES